MSHQEVFTGSALEKALKSGELQAGTAGAELRGMVKASGLEDTFPSGR